MIPKIIADGKSERPFLDRLRARGEAEDFYEATLAIVREVREKGDAALLAYAKKFDGAEEIEILDRTALESAFLSLDPAFRGTLERAKSNIEDYHARQKRTGFEYERKGCLLGQKIRPLKRVGLYVPGGTASYPSSVLMNAIPAKIAGVSEIVMATPKRNADILGAAYLAGVDKVVLAGGAQAIAALAYGTESVPRVDKIVGPGNVFVATAKKIVFGACDIDMIAGPSEILVVADGTADPRYLAADLMSQAEHDRLASAVLLTTEERIADETIEELKRQCALLSRSDIVESSLSAYGAAIVCRDLDEAREIANEISPEHLELMIEDAEKYVEEFDCAGSVFLGKYAPEPLGDYFAGPNHVLPTSGTARFASPLSVDSFLKKYSYIRYTEEEFRLAAPDVTRFAEREGLTAHANSIRVRTEK